MTVLMLLLVVATTTIDNGLGRTPLMGWNSWLTYGCQINETIITKIADKLVATAMQDVGYNYLNLGDCWQMGRDQQTNIIVPNNTAFPKGMSWLASYIHNKGLQIGIHSGGGLRTCANMTSSYGYENIDAQTYNKWGINYVSYDNCLPNDTVRNIYTAMSNALNATDHPVYYQLWGNEYGMQQWASTIANSWFSSTTRSQSWSGVIRMLNEQQYMQQYAAPGGWNNPGPLLVGLNSLNYQEQLAQFVLWAALKAPLIINCNLIDMQQTTLAIINNQEIININQDPLGIPATLIRKEVYTNGIQEVWGSFLSNSRYVVIFFNQGTATVAMKVSLSKQLLIKCNLYTIWDPLRHKSMGSSVSDQLPVEGVQSHSVQVRIITLRGFSGELLSQ